MNTMLTRIGKSRGGGVRRFVLVAAALVALTAGAAQEASAALPWVDEASLLQGRYDHAATLLGNGKVLVMGGAATTFVASPELYDPTTKTWTATGGLTSTSARQRQTATLLANGKVLIAGGFTSAGGSGTSTTRIYDPATNVWSVGPNMVVARFNHTATLLQNGKVLVVGGFGPVTSAELYDLSRTAGRRRRRRRSLANSTRRRCSRTARSS